MKLKSYPALVALSTVIALGAVAVLIAVFVVISAVDTLQMGLYDTEYNETFVGADACMEGALLELNSDNSYLGGSTTIGFVDCVITVSGSGGSRVIRIVATQGTVYISTLEADVDLTTNPISISNWEEVL